MRNPTKVFGFALSEEYCLRTESLDRMKIMTNEENCPALLP